MEYSEITRTINTLTKLENALITKALSYPNTKGKETEIVETLRNNLSSLYIDLQQIRKEIKESEKDG